MVEVYGSNGVRSRLLRLHRCRRGRDSRGLGTDESTRGEAKNEKDDYQGSEEDRRENEEENAEEEDPEDDAAVTAGSREAPLSFEKCRSSLGCFESHPAVQQSSKAGLIVE